MPDKSLETLALREQVFRLTGITLPDEPMNQTGAAFRSLVALLRSQDERALRIVEEVKKKATLSMAMSPAFRDGRLDACDEIKRRLKAPDA